METQFIQNLKKLGNLPCQAHSEDQEKLKYVCILKSCSQFLQPCCTDCMVEYHDHETKYFVKIQQFLSKIGTIVEFSPDQVKIEQEEEIKNIFHKISEDWQKISEKCQQMSQFMLKDGEKYSQKYTDEFCQIQTKKHLQNLLKEKQIDSGILQSYLQNIHEYLNLSEIQQSNLSNLSVTSKQINTIGTQNIEQEDLTIKKLAERYQIYSQNFIEETLMQIQKSTKFQDFQALKFIKSKNPLHANSVEELTPGKEFTIKPGSTDGGCRTICTSEFFTKDRHGFTLQVLNKENMANSCMLAVGVYEEQHYQNSADTWGGLFPFKCLLNGCAQHMSHGQGYLDLWQQQDEDADAVVKCVLDFEQNVFIVSDLEENTVYTSQNYDFTGKKMRLYVNFWSQNHGGEQARILLSDMF